jgi:hypothetical protein
MTEYRSAFYPDHALESFDVQRTAGAAGDWGGYYVRAIWRGPQGATYCGCLHFDHFDPDSALSCITRWHEVRMPGSGAPAVPDVIEGTVAPEDVVRANMRAAGFPVRGIPSTAESGSGLVSGLLVGEDSFDDFGSRLVIGGGA